MVIGYMRSGFDLIRCLLTIITQVKYMHRGSLRGKQGSDGFTYTTSTTGDNSYFILETEHSSLIRGSMNQVIAIQIYRNHL
jgi:hypothetical protein